MLIITADDYGKNSIATEAILECFRKKRITSASAMVFMQDSERAASLVVEDGLEVGLHLNFTEPFDGPGLSRNLLTHQERIIAYFSKHKLSQVFFNPFLSESFNIVCSAQREEFARLYGRSPGFYNGHHHMHLCANVLAGDLIPKGTKVRGTFTFERGEKDLFNRLYRRLLGIRIKNKFVSPDSFFSIAPLQNHERLRRIFSRANREAVEIEVHPEIPEEMGFLLSDQFTDLIDPIQLGGFRDTVAKDSLVSGT
jgi:predicted glycoside hydrolase/deacetylase ChbG (UPF0249 family)